ncbi:MAG: MFS transporter [Eggerthella lenta]
MGKAGKFRESTASMLPVLLACSFTASFGQSMMNVALPELAERFGITLSIANWVIVGYMVVAATAIMLAAFMLRRLRLRRVFFVGAGRLRSEARSRWFRRTSPCCSPAASCRRWARACSSRR